MNVLSSQKILIVDDNSINRELLREIFDGEYQILEACDGEEAIKLLDEYFDELIIVFLDMVMPKKNGLEVLSHMHEKDYIKYIPVMMITGESTPDLEEKAYSLGVSDIVYKPFYPRIVRKRTQNVVQLFQNRLHLENKLEARTRALQKSRRKLQKNTEFLINALSSVVEYRNRESEDHTGRVKYITKILLDCYMYEHPYMMITSDEADDIVRASTLHDIGKIAIPDALILKKDPLTEEERRLIQKHTIDGCKLLENFKQEENAFYMFCYDICRYHHERYDGSGYPEGLVGDDIPLWAQIVGLADTVDALCSERVYRPTFDFEDAFTQIIEAEKDKFSPDLIECLKKSKKKICDIIIFGVPE